MIRHAHFRYRIAECAGKLRVARWTATADVKRRYASASVLTAERIVFNIKGNDYRLVTAIDFEKGIVWIKWLGTHREYDAIDAKGVDHGNARNPRNTRQAR